MKNIFEGAKFGDKFLTRDGRKSVYIGYIDYLHYIIIEGTNGIVNHYNSDGTKCGMHYKEYDIVSKYQEPINNEKKVIIDKACKWLYKSIPRIKEVYLDIDISERDKEDVIENFKQVMMEE